MMVAKERHSCLAVCLLLEQQCSVLASGSPSPSHVQSAIAVAMVPYPRSLSAPSWGRGNSISTALSCWEETSGSETSREVLEEVLISSLQITPDEHGSDMAQVQSHSETEFASSEIIHTSATLVCIIPEYNIIWLYCSHVLHCFRFVLHLHSPSG